jgi:prepilin-type N-terminal cleavage/methylation domain-containing protein
MKNEKGVTLIELLAALVIFGIFSVIIWGFVIQTSKANDIEMVKQSLQQEANLIVTTFDEVHRKSGIKEVFITEDNTLEILSESGDYSVFNKPDVHYSLPSEFRKPEGKNFSIDLTLTSIKNEHISTSIKTTFTKLK